MSEDRAKEIEICMFTMPSGKRRFMKTNIVTDLMEMTDVLPLRYTRKQSVEELLTIASRSNKQRKV